MFSKLIDTQQISAFWKSLADKVYLYLLNNNLNI